MRVSRLRFFNYLPNRKLLLRPRPKTRSLCWVIDGAKGPRWFVAVLRDQLFVRRRATIDAALEGVSGL
jgi:hypothetical protein